jgi:hypothetical protein
MEKDILNNKLHDKLYSDFEPASLGDLESLKLLNRYDSKYIVKKSQLIDVLTSVVSDYKVLEIDGKRDFEYQNQYFDTKDLMLYNIHHSGKLNRYKVRYRHYVDIDRYFFEMKFKTNKSKTEKTRMNKKGFETSINGGADQIILNSLGISADNLFPTLDISYNRITLMNLESKEKITLDYNLNFDNYNNTKHLEDLAIIEIKLDRLKPHTAFTNILKQQGIRPVKISKYCLGIVLTTPGVKYNRFKEKILYINQLCDLNYEF